MLKEETRAKAPHHNTSKEQLFDKSLMLMKVNSDESVEAKGLQQLTYSK